MKAVLRLAVVALALLGLQPARAAVGFFDYTFYPGQNLFCPPLATFLADSNRLSQLFTAPLPDHTTVALWDPVTRAYGASAEYTNGSWSADLQVPSGIGARLTTTAAFTTVFVGTVLDHDGSVYDTSLPFHPPRPYLGPGGVYLLGDKAPLPATGSAIFTNILGRAPRDGEQITRLVASSQTYVTSTFSAANGWNIEPSLGAGEAAFFNIGAPPPPPRLSIALFGTTQVQVSWDGEVQGASLYYATQLQPTGWMPVTATPVAAGGRWVVTLNHDGLQKFFTLRYP